MCARTPVTKRRRACMCGARNDEERRKIAIASTSPSPPQLTVHNHHHHHHRPGVICRRYPPIHPSIRPTRHVVVHAVYIGNARCRAPPRQQNRTIPNTSSLLVSAATRAHLRPLFFAARRNSSLRFCAPLSASHRHLNPSPWTAAHPARSCTTTELGFYSFTYYTIYY